MKTITILANSLFLAVLLSVPASAATIAASSIFYDLGTATEPAPDAFGITNLSDAATILSVEINLSGAALNAPVFDTQDGASANYAYGAQNGSPIVGLTPDWVGFVEPTAAEQASWEEGQVINLSFTHFEPGETFWFNTDVDDLIDHRVLGEEIAGAWIDVTFLLASGQTRMLSMIYADLPGDSPVDAYAESAAAVPIPAALWLFGSGLLLLGGRRRHA